MQSEKGYHRPVRHWDEQTVTCRGGCGQEIRLNPGDACGESRFCPRCWAQREERIRRYAERAAREQPLFDHEIWRRETSGTQEIA